MATRPDAASVGSETQRQSQEPCCIEKTEAVGPSCHMRVCRDYCAVANYVLNATGRFHGSQGTKHYEQGDCASPSFSTCACTQDSSKCGSVGQAMPARLHQQCKCQLPCSTLIACTEKKGHRYNVWRQAAKPHAPQHEHIPSQCDVAS
eukprot:CAMPEP_0179151554 /NCGR_PEP_ID=MMETSP0796-20121207/73589_1 /TAXON_ID=73915 /ORGANISM="Pyrodinium bahamense, Strain pbaha01" /LENGTH=147 /DNA_ID=CAMNT_0020852667 /DNA_START=158 /DNA_END=601 /DNA_ORIENTATION=-